MDKYLVPLSPSPEKPNPIPRHRWKRTAIELNGRFEPKYRYEISSLLMQSYSEIGAFPHSYHIDGFPCQTHMNQIANGASIEGQVPIRKQGISALEFDNKETILKSRLKPQLYFEVIRNEAPSDHHPLIDGIYLASVTKSGCLTVHDFEALYCQSNESLPSSKEDEAKHLMHLSLHKQLDVVRWNCANQDEVACTSMKRNEVLIFDIGYVSSEPVEVLRTRHSVTVHGSDSHKGLSDIAFTSIDDSRLLASDTSGVISVWDRRMSTLPCLELTTNSQSTLNSIELNVENQVIFGAGKHGVIYMWDIRGGRGSAAFQSHKEVCHPPLTSLKLASMLGKIESLKAQSHIVSKEIHSIDLDPSCPYQLAFHLDDGWSGVLDLYNFQVTHVHCPPRLGWVRNDSNTSSDLLHLRKPSWLPTYSIYAVGSSSDKGVHLLDFYPDPSSASHVDHNENIESFSGINHQKKQNRFVPLSEGVTACAAHPLNGTIIAGTKVKKQQLKPLTLELLNLCRIEDMQQNGNRTDSCGSIKWSFKAVRESFVN